MNELNRFLAVIERGEPVYRSLYAELHCRERLSFSSVRDRTPPAGRMRPEFRKRWEERWAADRLDAMCTVVRVLADGSSLRIEKESILEPGGERTDPWRNWLVQSDGRWLFEQCEEYETGTGECPHRTLQGDFKRHFDSWRIADFLSHYALEPIGRSTVAGVPCLRVRAKRLPSAPWGSCWSLTLEEDALELALDPARGVILGAACWRDGEVLATSRVRKIAFDELITPALFACTPSLQARRYGISEPTRHVSLEKAIAEMPFRVYLPAHTYENSFLSCSWTPSPRSPQRKSRLAVGVSSVVVEREGPSGEGPSVRLFCRVGRYGDLLRIAESKTRPLDHTAFEWESIVKDGRLVSLSCPLEPGAQSLCRVCLGDTHVEIMTDLPRELLIDLAASFEPAVADARAFGVGSCREPDSSW